MLQPQSESHATTFLVSFYNQNVRTLVKDNQSHDFFEDHWADIHVQDVVAEDETEARALLLLRFPSKDGFVIDRVELAH